MFILSKITQYYTKTKTTNFLGDDPGNPPPPPTLPCDITNTFNTAKAIMLYVVLCGENTRKIIFVKSYCL